MATGTELTDRSVETALGEHRRESSGFDSMTQAETGTHSFSGELLSSYGRSTCRAPGQVSRWLWDAWGSAYSGCGELEDPGEPWKKVVDSHSDGQWRSLLDSPNPISPLKWTGSLTHFFFVLIFFLSLKRFSRYLLGTIYVLLLLLMLWRSYLPPAASS